MHVTNRVVTANTTRLLIFRSRVRAFDRVDDFLMTLATGLFSNFAAHGCDVYVVFKPAGGEVVGMPETVARFGCVLRDQSGRRVAIVADGDGAMARLYPTAKLVLHHMTVHTRLSVVSHV